MSASTDLPAAADVRSTEVPAQLAPVRRGSQPAPARVPALAHLSLAELRAYRKDLGNEESRVSYWRRLVQARCDVLDSARLHRPERLRDVLAHGQSGPARSAFLTLEATAALPDLAALPELPDLVALWSEVDPQDNEARSELMGRLAAADLALSTYRKGLHERLDLATRELVARYAEDPRQCLVALPLP
ncbi:RsiG family protein [Motilibacter deserti]|uniref:RsiG family protein n=1 Tax=Motilibacter deserti TaxID=2714956 RepID=UPI0018C8A7BE|nr:hypothetical protein [Motilibacter deserti]